MMTLLEKFRSWITCGLFISFTYRSELHQDRLPSEYGTRNYFMSIDLQLEAAWNRGGWRLELAYVD